LGKGGKGSDDKEEKTGDKEEKAGDKDIKGKMLKHFAW